MSTTLHRFQSWSRRSPRPSKRDSWVSILLIGFALTGCIISAGGRDFPPVNPATLLIGKTTRNEIEQAYGPPESSGQFTKNGQIVSVIHYYYAVHNTGTRMIYKRHAFFYFLGDRFLGHATVTGFPEEQRDFDERRVPQLVKGKSNRAEVLALFGTPELFLIYPMTPEKISQEGDTSVRYSYEVRSTAGRSFTDKQLSVTFDANGIVKDVDFTINQKSEPKNPDISEARY